MKYLYQLSKMSISYQSLSGLNSIRGITSLAVPIPVGYQVENSRREVKEIRSILSQESLYWLEKENILLSKIVLACQVHGKEIHYAVKPGIYQNIDGFYTDQQNLALTVFTADCAAVMVSVPSIPVIGIVHAGWRGIQINIIQCVIQKILNCWNVDTREIQIVVSPHIKKCCYTVGKEFLNYFSDEYIDEHNGLYYLDLEGILFHQLRQLEIPQKNINIIPFCTACSTIPLYSFRKQKTDKRLLNIIEINGKEN